VRGRLLRHRGADLGEGAGDLTLQGVHGRDQHHGDEGGDQTILDGGRAGFVLQEAGDKLRHCSISFVAASRRFGDQAFACPPRIRRITIAYRA
jgi:hypothetical protein